MTTAPFITVLIPARDSVHCLEETVSLLMTFFEARFRNHYEIILIPSKVPSAGDDGSYSVAYRLALSYPTLRVIPHDLPEGKGAALKTGFLAAKGEWIFMTDADMPYDLTFFEKARDLLGSGVDFVTGNRRLEDSFFTASVVLLPFIYRRYKLGLYFNSITRWCLGIATFDTQAGIKAMTRKFAEAAFSHQSCPGFLFDIEHFLVCQSNGFRHAEVSVKFILRDEKSTVRLMRELMSSSYWLWRFFFRKLRGYYRIGKRDAMPFAPLPSPVCPRSF